MTWKVLYDFSRPNWQTFGHVIYVEAETQCQAESLGLKAAAFREDGATITRLSVTVSTSQARERHEKRVRAQQYNVRSSE
jgi:hypothetical protein